MAKQISFEDFCEKFKPKKTTDDCYTPPTIYEVIKNWACKEYGIDPDKIVRPFYPGGDYENLTTRRTQWCWTTRRFRYWRKFVSFIWSAEYRFFCSRQALRA